MTQKDYIDKIKFQLTGGVLESELDNDAYKRIVNIALEEMNNYYNVTELLQVNASSCIDLKDYPRVLNVVGVHRTAGVNVPAPTSSDSTSTLTISATTSDPMYMSQLQAYGLGTMGMSTNTMYRMTSTILSQKLANTLSTDLDFRYDEKNQKLYISFSQGVPAQVVVEYVPKLEDASEVVSKYWQDILYKLALAHAKVIVGRIRTRYVQSNALWTDDGSSILDEGATELANLREQLRVAADLVLPLD